MTYEKLRPFIQQDFAGNVTYTALSEEEVIALKAKYRKQIIDLCGGDTSIVSNLLKNRQQSFDRMGVEDCEKLVYEIQAMMTNKLQEKEKENNNE
jgi:hypothetical protein